MPIHAVSIGNFKGIAGVTEVVIKPITIFIGENSSGKSTVIHALASLAQSVRLPNDTRPLILDDEVATVHLGRFIEVMHSRNYNDAICLGVNVGTKPLTVLRASSSEENIEEGIVKACYEFKSTKTTQDVYLQGGMMSCGARQYTLKRARGRRQYILELAGVEPGLRVWSESGFLVMDRSIHRRTEKSFREFYPFLLGQRNIVTELKKVMYLGPFRQPPQRRYQTRGSSPREVGAQGEATIPLLANEAIQSRSRRHIKEIAKWLEVSTVAKNLKVQRVAGSDLFDVLVTLNDGRTHPLADVGYGLSQVLPVLTQCSFAPDGGTLLFEQPELHVHPLAQRPLARVFIEAAKQKNLHIVAETHSPDLLGEFITQIRNGNLMASDFAAYRVKRIDQQTKVEEIKIEAVTLADGTFDVDVFYNWQTGFSSTV